MWATLTALVVLSQQVSFSASGIDKNKQIERKECKPHPGTDFPVGNMQDGPKFKIAFDCSTLYGRVNIDKCTLTYPDGGSSKTAEAGDSPGYMYNEFISDGKHYILNCYSSLKPAIYITYNPLWDVNGKIDACTKTQPFRAASDDETAEPVMFDVSFTCNWRQTEVKECHLQYMDGKTKTTVDVKSGSESPPFVSNKNRYKLVCFATQSPYIGPAVFGKCSPYSNLQYSALYDPNEAKFRIVFACRKGSRKMVERCTLTYPDGNKQLTVEAGEMLGYKDNEFVSNGNHYTFTCYINEEPSIFFTTAPIWNVNGKIDACKKKKQPFPVSKKDSSDTFDMWFTCNFGSTKVKECHLEYPAEGNKLTKIDIKQGKDKEFTTVNGKKYQAYCHELSLPAIYEA